MVKRLNIKGPKSLLIEGLGPKVNDVLDVLFFVIIIIFLLLFYTNLFILLFMFKNKTKNVLKNYNETKKLHVYFFLPFVIWHGRPIQRSSWDNISLQALV